MSDITVSSDIDEEAIERLQKEMCIGFAPELELYVRENAPVKTGFMRDHTTVVPSEEEEGTFDIAVDAHYASYVEDRTHWLENSLMRLKEVIENALDNSGT